MSDQERRAATDLAHSALTRLSEKWTGRVLRELASLPLTYGVLRRRIGVSAKVLTVTLRALERDGYILRVVSPSVRLQVTYDLTALGRALLKLLTDVEAWAQEYEPEAPRHAVAVPSIAYRRMPAADDASEPRVALDAYPTHLCLAIKDLDAAVSEFSAIFGVDSGPLGFGTVTAPDLARGNIKRRAFAIPNFVIEMIQPTDGSSAFHDFLKRSGQGVHHLGLRTRADFGEQMRVLERRGGRRTAGSLQEHYALFDFNDQFGSTLEIVQPALDLGGRPRIHLERPDALASYGVGYVGILVRDVVDAAAQYTSLLGITAPPVRTTSVVFPGRSYPRASIRFIAIRQGQIALLLIEPVGPSPWRDMVDAYGNTVHHVSFHVGARMEGIVSELRRRGARQVLGRPGVSYAHFDFTRDFGLVLGLTA